MGTQKYNDFGRKIIATVIAVKGCCNAGHAVGDQFQLSCRYPDGLCGYFYHDIFPALSVIQHGGKYPWWDEDQTVFEYTCPDKKNLLTLRLEVIHQS